ncbi:MAG: undecaprenyldiphospho-muramoylpentapeptide beta-N-acetylglucosaminyltransferase [Bacteroidetes bacterium]|nr:undecaprenyldiphospho-muramoylpentapeptide beta-N-acetylglucosaminyltransferase [Bacteroidota bacterium]HET6245585.1 undecaprenyldiphospho-muramoylpentapeptide beta-N-acetylglucosaminyltransferase [Bacteroidia bacterium]
MRQYKVIISGGGTGGHIFPAIAIANALKQKLQDNVEILFVGALGRMEMEKVPAAGFKIEGLWISGLQRSLSIKNLSFPFKVLSSFLKAKKILNRFKPDVVVGVGGYASGPILAAAIFKKIPTLIQEQNSYAGITNKILGKKADKICVAYDGMEKFFAKNKIILTGNPVRQDILNLVGKKDRALEHFDLKTEKKTLLVIGGSLGARTINQSILNNLDLFKKNDIQLVWQTGKTFYPEAKQAVDKLDSSSLKVFDFISKMDLAYAIADVVVSRAGASSVSELCLVKKPSILVPSPNVAEDHQTKNSMALVNHNAAIMIKDSDSFQNLAIAAIDLLNSEEKQYKLSENIAKLAFKDSAGVIASEILNLVKTK